MSRVCALRSLLVVTLCVLLSVACAREVQVVQTSKGTNERLAVKAPLQMITVTTSGSEGSHHDGHALKREALKREATVVVDKSVRYQSVLGFGGAFTEATAYVMSQLKPELQNEIVQVSMLLQCQFLIFWEDHLRGSIRS